MGGRGACLTIQLAGWEQRHVAVCNHCHVPPTSSSGSVLSLVKAQAWRIPRRSAVGVCLRRPPEGDAVRAPPGRCAHDRAHPGRCRVPHRGAAGRDALREAGDVVGQAREPCAEPVKALARGVLVLKIAGSMMVNLVAPTLYNGEDGNGAGATAVINVL